MLIILESTRLRVLVWKEKALPTLLYGFDDETQSLLRANETLELSEDKLKVRFECDEKISRLGFYSAWSRVGWKVTQ
jgi:hypothetical protein